MALPVADVDAEVLGWVADRAEELLALAATDGAVVIDARRRLGSDGTGRADLLAVLGQLPAAFGGVAASPRENFAPRSELAPGVWTTPDWSGDREMCAHHEGAHLADPPTWLLMAPVRPADSGGEIFVSDTRKALRDLPSDLRDGFASHGWLLQRHFRQHFGVGWVDVFGTKDPERAEELAGQWRLDLTWGRDGSLRAVSRRPAIVRHPRSGADCWFNQVAFLNHLSVPEAERAVLLGAFGVDGLPLTTLRGDGAAVTPEQYDAMSRAYLAAQQPVELLSGQILLVDNVAAAHGRAPFTGDRMVAEVPFGPGAAA